MNTILGQEFGKLLVIKKKGIPGKRHMYLCGCECGQQIVVSRRHLEEGIIASCGCGKKRQRNLAGYKFGDLVVVGFAKPIDGQDAVKCRCTLCGKISVVKRSFILLGSAGVCGCTTAAGVVETYPEEREIWHAMRLRCKQHPNYAGRGIKVCRGWRSFDAFIKSVGPRPMNAFTIERNDNDGNYSCGECDQCKENSWRMNCRWATRREQNENKRNTLKAYWHGEELPVSLIAIRQSVQYKKLYELLVQGMEAEDAVAKLKHQQSL